MEATRPRQKGLFLYASDVDLYSTSFLLRFIGDMLDTARRNKKQRRAVTQGDLQRELDPVTHVGQTLG